MLFNSPEFILLFLPATLLACLLLRPVLSSRGIVVLMILASLIFYGWWDWRYVALIMASIAGNFLLGTHILKVTPDNRPAAKRLLTIGVAANLALLGFYKYTNFLLEIASQVSGASLPSYDIALPLAISFFTFLQIAFIVDCYRSPQPNLKVGSYSLFVLYFPHLIAGPLVHHKSLIPQLEADSFARLNWTGIGTGLGIFVLGLFKKVCLADTFAEFASPGFDQAQTLSFLEAWATALSYTFQLYFDFSGYCDMAIGLSLMFNVKLPANFDAPYRALSIQDFWQRWHITLGRFLRDYLYIPLGGNRGARYLTLRNLFITFLLGGIWHGAGWTFVIWGALHGAGLCVHRLWSDGGRRLPKPLAWALTFLFVVVGWVFFRAEDVDSALVVLRGMMGLDGFYLNAIVLSVVPSLGVLFEPVAKLRYFADGSLMGLVEFAGMFALAVAIVAFGRPLQTMDPKSKWIAWGAIAVAPFVIHQVFFSSAPSPFLYFRF